MRLLVPMKTILTGSGRDTDPEQPKSDFASHGAHLTRQNVSLWVA